MKQPYQITIKKVLERFHTSAEKGLTKKEVKEHRKEYGPNTLPEKKPDSLFLIFISQFQSPLIYMLLVAAVLLFFFADHVKDSYIIAGVLLLNAIIGTMQEGRTANILAGLSKFIKTDALVIRDGKRQVIDEKDIVVGDILVLQAGDRIAADARVIESNNLKVDEAVLTGESTSIQKILEPIKKNDLPITDQKNMVFKGTVITSGSGRAIVVATGVETELGKIHLSIEKIDTHMPLKKEIDQVAYWILGLVLSACVVLFIIGYVTEKPLRQMVITLTALFVSGVPEGLPVVLTLVLVAGVYRMAQKNVLVKRMQAVEGLGRTQVIVVDKTGTLTRNEMMVSRVCAEGAMYKVSGEGYHANGAITQNGESVSIEGDSDIYRMAVANSLLNSTEIKFDKKTKLFEVKGEPTEAALYVFSKKVGLKQHELEKEYTKLYEIPFDSILRYHAGFYDHNGQGIAFLSGSPEEMIARSEDGSSDDCYNKLLEEGLRVVATAQKEFDLGKIPEGEEDRIAFFKDIAENKIKLLGFCGIEDAIRPEVPGIVAKAQDAGIRVVMATGDHPSTAKSIAKQAGMLHEGDMAVTGPEFQKMSEEEHLADLDKITIYARVTPQDKLDIVNNMSKKGLMVAMTGDGVNDAPSLLAADLGIAMGNIGTEVAKDASDMILLDDSFGSIISAVEQGRHIFYTLKRVILYFLATSCAEIILILVSLVLRLPLPLTASQIIWLNLITDSPFGITLAMEPQEPDLLEQKFWLTEKVKLVDLSMIGIMFNMVVAMAIGSTLVFLYYYQSDLNLARTMTLVTMAMLQWFNAWNCRSTTRSIFQLNFFANPWLLLVMVVVLAMQLLLVYVPFMQFLFETVPLTFNQWIFAIGTSSSILLFEEVRKVIKRTWFPNQ